MADDKNAQDRLLEQQKKFNDEITKSNKLMEALFENEQNIQVELQKAIDKAKDLNKNFGKGIDITQDLNDQRIQNAKEIDKFERDIAKKQAALARARTVATQEKLIDEIKSLKNQIKITEQIDTQLLSLLEFIKAQQRLLEEEKKRNSLLGIAKDYYNKNVKEAFTLLGILKFIGNAILKSDEQTTSLAKSFGITKSAAYDIRQNMVAFSRAADSSFINVNRLFQAQQALTEQLGIAVDFGGKEQEQFSRLTEIVGLTADEAGKLAKFSAVNGISTDKYVADIREAVFYAQRTNKIHVSDKETLSTISRLSAGILVKFQNNPKALAEAVVQAKKLGTSLEQIDKIGDSLLDWQSSIQNELEAELITNRKLNFEAARYAALTGNQTTLMQEMTKQAGSLAEFQNMNVIAQESLAKAFGVSKDDMADMLLKQQMINKYGSEAEKLNAQQLEDFQKSGLSLTEYLEKQDQQRSIQEKFNDAIAKLQDLVGNLVAGPFGRLLDIMISITEHTKLLAALASVYIARLLVINGLKLREYILSKKSAGVSIADAVATAVKSASSIPVVGWVIGAGLAATLYAGLTGMLSKGDDVVSAGYGKRMLLDKDSITAFNDNDTIIAGTNLNKGGGGGGNNTELLRQQQRTNELLEKSLNRPAVALIDGENPFVDKMSRNPRFGANQMIQAYGLV